MHKVNIKYYKEGILGAIFFHVVLGTILFLFGYSTLPVPIPNDQGILINFGDNAEGAGKNEPSPVKKIEPPKLVDNKESIITQDIEDAPAIKEKDIKKKDVIKQKNTTVKEKTKPIEQTKAVNPLALYKKNTNASEGEGETSGNTNQGDEKGSMDSKSHTGGLGGDGKSFSLSGRSALSLPEPEYNYQVEGKVVVEIIVDKQGNVTSATPGVKGSTTLNNYLLTKAKDAALKAKFDIKTDAPAYQKGTITYYFLLQ